MKPLLLLLLLCLGSCANRQPAQPTVIAITHGKDITSVVIPPPPPTNILTNLMGDTANLAITAFQHLFGL